MGITNPAAFPLRYAVVGLTGAVNMDPAEPPDTIPFDVGIAALNWPIITPASFTIPSGVTVVEFTLGASLFGTAGDILYFRLRKNGVNFGWPGNFETVCELYTNGGFSAYAQSDPLQVIAGDIFEVSPLFIGANVVALQSQYSWFAARALG